MLRSTHEACTVRDSAEPKKCANCGGSHSASYRGCSKFLLAKQVTHRDTEKHLSYRDALIQIKKENREATQSAGPATLETGSVTLNIVELARNSTHTVLPRAPEALAAVKSSSCNVGCQTSIVGNIDHDTEPNFGVVEPGNNSRLAASFTLNIYELLGVLCKLLDEPVISRASILQGLLSYTADKLKQPIEQVRCNIDKAQGGDLNTFNGMHEALSPIKQN